MDEIPSLPFGNVPKLWRGSVAVEVIPGTRWFVEKGPIAKFRHWLRELQEANPDGLLPMQWAPQYIGVTRTAIRKRALAGNLTVFTFELENFEPTLLGKVKYGEGRSSFDYLVVEECEEWSLKLYGQAQDRAAKDAASKKGRKKGRRK